MKILGRTAIVLAVLAVTLSGCYYAYNKELAARVAATDAEREAQMHASEHPQILSSYDKYEDKTTVTMDAATWLIKQDDFAVNVKPSLSCKGSARCAGESVFNLTFVSSREAALSWGFLQSRDLVLLYDGDRWKAARVAHTFSTSGRFLMEYMVVSIPRDVLVRISTAAESTGKLGAFEFTVSPVTKKSFAEFAAAVK